MLELLFGVTLVLELTLQWATFGSAALLPVFSVATTETLEGSYRANDGNDVLGDLGRKSPRRMQFPLTVDPSELTSPGRAQLAFA